MINTTVLIHTKNSSTNIIVQIYTMDTVFKQIVAFLQNEPYYITLFESEFRKACATAPVDDMITELLHMIQSQIASKSLLPILHNKCSLQHLTIRKHPRVCLL